MVAGAAVNNPNCWQVFTHGLDGVHHDISRGMQCVRDFVCDWDEASNLSKMLAKINVITDTFFHVTCPNGLMRASAAFGEICAVRRLIKKFTDLVSFDAAFEMVGGRREGRANPLRYLNKVAGTVSDVASTAKSLASFEIIPREWIDLPVARIQLFGKSLKGLQIVQDAAGVVSAVCMIPVEIVSMVEGIREAGAIGILKRTYLFDLATDITKIAESVLPYIPGVPPVAAAIAATIGCGISVMRYIKKTHFKDVGMPPREGPPVNDPDVRAEQALNDPEGGEDRALNDQPGEGLSEALNCAGSASHEVSADELSPSDDDKKPGSLPSSSTGTSPISSDNENESAA